jgi:molecular chaperone DnaJ
LSKSKDKDYYQILGVGKDATVDEIKKAYRKGALKYHPDTNKAPDADGQFKLIAEAYNVLSNPEQRKQYDYFQSTGNHFQSSPFNVEDIFSQFFGGFHGTFKQRSGGFHGFKNKSKDILVRLSLTFVESVMGCVKDVKITRTSECKKCNGTGASEMVACSDCKGVGFTVMRQAMFEIRQECGQCNGSGQVSSKTCDECNGSGSIKGQEETVSVQVPAGIDSGMSLRIQGNGNAPNGDLIVSFDVAKHEVFERKGFDLICTVPVTYSQLVLGHKMLLPTIQGQSVEFSILPGTESGKSFRLQGLGVPILKSTKFRATDVGDLRVMVRLVVPKKPSDEYKQLLQKLNKLDMVENTVETSAQKKSVKT